MIFLFWIQFLLLSQIYKWQINYLGSTNKEWRRSWMMDWKPFRGKGFLSQQAGEHCSQSYFLCHNLELTLNWMSQQGTWQHCTLLTSPVFFALCLLKEWNLSFEPYIYLIHSNHNTSLRFAKMQILNLDERRWIFPRYSNSELDWNWEVNIFVSIRASWWPFPSYSLQTLA